MLNIRVAVRIRPFSQRELICNDEIIVRKEGSCIFVTNPKIPGKYEGDSRKRTRRFMVDFCYDPNDPETSSQEAVYEEIGLEVLDSMFGGYNACVLAYGHSASGKTYTMMGLPEDPGLTPRICQGLFDKIETKSTIQFHVAVSFLEIYNEKVRDLLVKDDGGGSDNFSLRVREHPKLGPYVQDLSHHLVTDRSRLLELLDFGNKRRRTAATENNVHSSRSHAVFTLWLKQTDGDSYDIDKSSKVHLVDLAGSERASGPPNKARLKEGANINKSLVTLGNVISALAENYETSAKEHSSLRTCQAFVPYRDSILTWLLKDTLGGNSNTIMIATVSPASSCLNETVNTLRYAKRTKRIINQPIMNEDPKVRTIRELREEILRLKCILSSYCGKRDSVNEFSQFGNANFMEFKKSNETVREWLEPSEVAVQYADNRKNMIEVDPRREGSIRSKADGYSEGISNSGGGGGDDDDDDDDDGRVIYQDLNVPREQISEGGDYKKSPGNKSSFPHTFLGISSSSNGDARKINDVKESGVNESEIDSIHEAAFFSDSLESFTGSLLKSQQSFAEVENNESERMDVRSDHSILVEGQEGQASEVNVAKDDSQGPCKKYKLCLKRELNSGENPLKINGSKVLHKSRPDLIKGISTHSKEGLISSASQSCTDVSNLSRSNSENSWASQGSLDASPPENKTSTASRLASRKIEFEPFVRKKDKRFEIVEAVTSRLYMAKNKADSKVEKLAKPDGFKEDGEFEELNLCKRARMKLCDASRKLMMTRKIKKTVETDTQTDFDKRTIRMKEKSVLTDQSGPISVEDCGTNTSSEDNLRDAWTSSWDDSNGFSQQVLVSGESNRRRQRDGCDVKTYSNCPMPVKYAVRDDKYFSEDSLDRDEPSKAVSLSGENSCGSDSKCTWNANDKPSFPPRYKKTEGESHEGLTTYKFHAEQPQKIVQKQIQVTLMNDLLPDSRTKPKIDTSIPRTIWPSRKEDGYLSENSSTSTESTDAGGLSGTSSEDFVFYESSPEKDESNRKMRTVGDRQLYTITENSEHSDLGDGFGSVESKRCTSSPLSLGFEGTTAITTSTAAGNAAGRYGNAVVSADGKFIRFQKRSFDRCNQNVFSDCGPMSGYFIANDREILRGRPGDYNVEMCETPRQVLSGNLETMSNQVFFPAYGNASRKLVVNLKDGSYESESVRAKCNVQQEKMRPKDICPPVEGHRDNCWTDLKTNNQTQTHFVNFNLLNSSERSRFSSLQFDTQIFREGLKKDQSTETVFGSEDSITFVFMGPAKPKTSVLMEVIRRSLNKRSAREIGLGQRKSRTRGIQCESKLMRSLSVDTALLALSRIAKQPTQDLPRTISLNNLGTEEMLLILEQGKQAMSLRESSCQCDLDANDVQVRLRKIPIRYSVATGTSRDQQTETSSQQRGTPEDGDESAIHTLADCGGVPEKAEDKKLCPGCEIPGLKVHTRRVRFSKADNNLHNGHRRSESVKLSKFNRSAKTISTFLKEATTFLRNLNHFKIQGYDEYLDREDATGREIRDWLRFKAYLSRDEPTKRTEASVQTECQGMTTRTASLSRCLLATGTNESSKSSTWPRRHQSTGKPPSGTSWRNLTNSRTTATADFTSFGSQSRADAGATSPKSIFRFFRRKCTARPFLQADRFAHTNTDYSSVSKLKKELEESCRRLKLAAEREEVRREMLEGRFQVRRENDAREKSSRKQVLNRSWDNSSKEEEEEEAEIAATAAEDGFRDTKIRWNGERVKERRMDMACIRKCFCKAKGKESCTCPRSKGFRSTFELNTFGPGSNHCHQFCIFCRQKDTELYCSTPSLNSECPAGRCRLNYYGHCPCSRVKLRHVATSPRAYMQHLLTLRRRIVEAT